ncbi:MAG: tetratricopeptide repeat protein [Cyclobacteriaceae bacterium]
MIRQSSISILFLLLSLTGLDGYAQSETRSAYQRQKQAMRQYQHAYTAYDRHYIAVADSLISSSILLNPKYPEAYYLRAMVREAQDNPFAALVDYETVIQLDPENIEARFKKGMLHYQLGNYEQALADANEVLHYDKSYETTTVYYKTGPDGSVTGASTIQRMEADLRNLMGLAYQGLETYDAAIEQFDAAIAINRDEPQYYNNKGMTELMTGDTTAALDTYHRGLVSDPSHQALLFNLSQLEDISTTQYTAMFEEAKNPTLFVQRAYEKFQQADYTGALKDYSTALKIEENKASIWLDRGRTYARLKQHKKAISDYKKALALDEALIKAYYLLADSYQVIGAYTQALDLYTLYLTEDTSSPSVYYNYAICLHLAGNDNKACQQLKQALKLGFVRASELQNTFCQNP